ncbi:DUF1254 domain-containing protein [Catellatospora methionotrophica]
MKRPAVVRAEITTPNSDIVHGLAFADLSKSGPLVIEVPPKV